jgi:L-aspartate oxidase
MNETVIVGAGLAGLFAALKLAPLPVTVISPKPLGEGASSVWAQAGIAAAIGEGDSADKHAADTLKAGAGLCDEAAVRLIVSEAPQRIEELLRYGVPFDRNLEGKLKLQREAAHSEKRVVGVNGDRAGAAIMAALIATVRNTPSIRVLENTAALDLAVADGRVVGIHCCAADGQHPEPWFLPARAVILATGGAGQLFRVTTNPAEARGDGLAMAARAGAAVADAEFVQFHPTALDVGKSPAPLATEALRGEGAWLVNRNGERFMERYHADMELAPRDIVARAVESERLAGRGAYLDCRAAIGDHFAAHFPTVYASCAEAGIDPARQLMPVAAAAHYYMGGVVTDADARTSIEGLWAIGEVACTGLHGANRLASNSLLEAVVMGGRAAEDVAAIELPRAKPYAIPPWPLHGAWSAPAGRIIPRAATVEHLRNCMSGGAGVVRGEASLAGLTNILAISERVYPLRPDIRNMRDVAMLIITSAYKRRESRGAHSRTDFPQTDPALARRTSTTLAEARAAYLDMLGSSEAVANRGRVLMAGEV